MMAKILGLKSIAALTIMMFFCMSISFVYAEMPTEDPLKTYENGEMVEKEEHQSETEDKKKEHLDKAQEDRGYGPFNSLDLYMNVIDAVEGLINGDRFGDALTNMMKKYGNAFKKEIELKMKKKMAEQKRKKQTETLLREEFAKQKASLEKTLEKRQEDSKKESKYIKAYNWFKSSKGGSKQQQDEGASTGN